MKEQDLKLFLVQKFDIFYIVFKDKFSKNKMIPDKIFTFWEGESLSYLHYMTILSLHKLNPDKKITIYTGIDGIMGNKWVGGEHSSNMEKKIPFSDILNISPNIILETIDFQKEYNIPNNISYVYKADITRIIKLYEHGGVWFDFDILFIKKIPETIFNNTVDIIYFSYEDTIATGLIASSCKNNKIKFIYDVLLNTVKSLDTNIYYQYIGPNLWRYCFSQALFNDGKTRCENTTDIYPYTWSVIHLFFETNVDLVSGNTWGIHWYNGGESCKKFINNGIKGDTTIEKYIKKIENIK